MPYLVTREGESFVQLLAQAPDEQAAFDLILARLSTIETYFTDSNNTYFPRDGSVPASSNWDMGGFKLTNLGAPTVGTDAVTKTYADALVSGYQPVDTDLTSLSALSGVGLAVRTGTGTWTTRNVASSHAAITVTNNTGVAGNITLGLDTTQLTALGGVTTGTWNATPIAVAYGGTGVTATPGHGDLLIGNGSGFALAGLTAGSGVSITNGAGTVQITNIGVTSITGTANQVIASAGTGGVTLSLPQSIATTSSPTFAQVTLSNAPTLGGHAASKDYVDTTVGGAYTAGTGIDLAAGVFSLAAGSNARSLNAVAVAGLATVTVAGTMAARTLTAGSSKVSVTNGAGVAGNPTIDVVEANLNLASIGGTLGIGQGGTGAGTASASFNALSPITTRGDLIYGSAASTASRLALGPSGYVLMSNGTDPFWSQASAIQVDTAVNVSGGAIGSILYQSAASTTAALALGTTGYVMTAGASAPQWSNSASLSVGSATNLLGGVAGALVYQSNTDASTTLTLGAPGQVLTAGASAPQWSNSNTLTAGSATHLTSGAAGSVPYQTGSGVTTMLGLGTSGYVMTAGASAPQWSNPGTFSVASAANLTGGAANQIVYQTGAGATSYLSTANNAVLVTNGAGAFSWSSTLPSGLTIADSRRSVSATVTAAGTTQGTATALTSDINVVTTVASGTGVVLATSVAGKSQVVVNRGANTLKVYPASGAAIDGLGTNAALSVPAGAQVEVRGSTATQLYSTMDSVLGNLLGGAAGSLPYQSAVNTTTMLSLGTTNYVLTAGASAPQWSNPAGITVGIATNVAGGAAGSLPYQTASNTTNLLGIGASTYLLSSSGTAPQWSNPASVTVGTATNVAGGAAGSLPYQSGAGATALLALGTAAYLLTAGASAPQWSNPTGVTVGAATTATNVAGGAAGSIPYQTGVGATSLLGIGTSTYLLTSSGTAPQWSNPSGVTVGAATAATNVSGGVAGNLLYQSGASTTAKLTLGSSGQVLTAGASAPQWSAQSSLAVGTATNVAGGVAGSLPYQTGAGATSLLGIGTSTYLLSSSGTAPQWSNPSGVTVGTATNLASGGANQIPYQTGAGATSFVASANNAVLVTSGAGAPSLSSTLPAGLTIPGSYRSTATGLVAAGTDQSTALALTADLNVVSGVSSGTGVKLPTAVAGRRVIVRHAGSVNPLAIYPASGAAIDSLAANAAISLTQNGWIQFDAMSSGQWYSTYQTAIAGVSSATNLAGGAANQIVYQTGSGTTGFVSAAANSVLVTNGSNVPSLSTTLPSGLSVPDGRRSLTTGISAAGTTQGTATALTSDINVVTTVASGTGVVLSTAAAGKSQTVVNRGANPLKVYPASGAAIDGQGANVAISIASGARLVFDAESATQWWSAAFDHVNRLSGGTAGDLPYQASTGGTTFLGIGTSSYILTSSGTAPQWSNPTGITVGLATNVAGGAANQIVYQSGAGTSAFLATANNGVLVTSGAGVPSISSTLPNGLTIGDQRQTLSATVTATGTTQGTAVALTSDFNVITAGAADTGVVLQTAVAGKSVWVSNRSGSNKKVYPASGAAINALAANAAYSVASGATICVRGSSATQWYSDQPVIDLSVSSGTLTPAQGGSGLTTISNVGELYYGNNTTNMGRIAPVAVGSVLISQGTNTPPVWSSTVSVTSVSANLSYLPIIYGQGGTGGSVTVRANAADLTTGYLNFPDTTDASSSVTGAARFAGGVGIAKSLYIGSVVSAPGLLNDTNNNLFTGANNLTTGSTNGFMYLPSVAGTPTGVPTSNTGRVPLAWDSVGSKVWAYSGGAWTGVGGGGVTLTDDTSTNTTYYPVFATATSGAATGVKVSSSKLNFNPSTGKFEATAFNSLSDARFKTDIVPLRKVGDALDTLNAYTYKVFGMQTLGWLAQEVQKVFPRAVTVADDGKLSLAYGPMVAVVAESLKEERALRKQLEAKVSSMEEELSRLQDLIKTLIETL